MAKGEMLSYRIHSGKISVYRRPDATAWQCSYRINNKLRRHTTGKDDLEEAKAAATEMYIVACIKFKEGIPTVSKSFKSVAAYAIEKMNNEIKSGAPKTTGYPSYIRHLNKWIIPFFGQKAITSIDYQAVQAFAQHREMTLKEIPSWVFINMQNCAMNRVFDAAVERGYLNRNSVPELPNNGNKTGKRPDFTMQEYKQLWEFEKEWIKGGNAGKNRTRRELLREYVFFIAHTGCRPGTETEGLRWRNIRITTIKGVDYIAITTMPGKTGQRELIARHNIKRYLRRLAKRNPAFNGLTLNEALLLKSDAFVFAMPDGSEVTHLGDTFTQLLVAAGLRVDPATGENHSFYSLRHMYITQALKNGVAIYTIASNCGTSVKMITEHYAHIKNEMMASSLAGREDLA